MAEFSPKAIHDMYDTIAQGIPAAVFCGIGGDTPGHTWGYHRSRNYDINFGRDGANDYSVQTAPDKKGNGDAASALDICWSHPSPQYVVTQRLLNAKTDPRMNVIREFFGSLDGQVVTGWDYYYNRHVVADNSHLWHIHISVLREFSQDHDALQAVADVVLGKHTNDFGGGGSSPTQAIGWHQWPVPKGVKTVEVTLLGAGSPNYGRGGKVVGRLAVKDTQTLFLFAGGHGKANNGPTGGAGGLGGGGHGGTGINHAGGDGGGGYSAIRLNGTAGTVLAAAGGAAGASGDSVAASGDITNGHGGQGGASTGQSGFDGKAGDGQTGLATGGTQDQGGNGGTSESGVRWFGHDADGHVLGTAGRGGWTNGKAGPGGGGGGGGYFGGGGGQGGLQGHTPAGGGGGGSNFTDRLTSVTSLRGAGEVNADGRVTLRWSDPVAGKQRPNAPHITAPTAGARLKDYSVTIKATLTDPDHNPNTKPPVTAKVRMRILVSNDNWKTQFGPFYSDWVVSGKVASYTHKGMNPNLHQRARVWAQDESKQLSLNYASVDYYTNASPTEPTLHLPHDGATIGTLSSTVFTWTHHDPDGGPSGSSEFRWWLADGSPDYHVVSIKGPADTWTLNPFTLKANHFYRWDVRTRDPLGLWGPRSTPFRLFSAGTTTAPVPLSPGKGEAVDVDGTTRLQWRFRDIDPHNTQRKADVRWKVVTADVWSQRLGSVTTPGGVQHWDFGPHTWQPGFSYEWQVRTYDTGGGGLVASDWSESLTFHAINTPGRDAAPLVLTGNEFAGTLGCGDNRAFLAVKGGHRLLGELGPATSITYSRLRDDISKCNVVLPVDCDTGLVCQLAAQARTWQNEIVVFRNSEQGQQRVWEGPVTRIEYAQDHVEIEAQDVMVWPYRRIMKQGFNDSYPNLQTVTYRATRLIVNALAADDPNILRYLTVLSFDDDAQESRIRADWQSTAWEEVDDMAAHTGLDYTTVGRRIILWDTHRPVGRLPLMRSDDFSTAPILTEYGMLLATEYGVTNNAGVYASATRDDAAYGPVELLVSAFGQSAAANGQTLTRQKRQKLQETLHKQAERGIATRWPAPVQVRVPDNSTIRPDSPVPFQYLIPGVWIPVQADHVCRVLSQWQKLDSVTVTQTAETGEQVAVVMSPAPNHGLDPDQIEEPPPPTPKPPPKPKPPPAPPPGPKPVRVDMMHASMQYTDPTGEQHKDAVKVFARAKSRNVWWITGTEATTSDISDLFKTAAESHGYRYFNLNGHGPRGNNGVWIAIDPVHVADDVTIGWSQVIDGVSGDYPDRGVLRATFRTGRIGRVTILASHYQIHAFSDGNPKIARQIGKLAREFGADQPLVFYGGDQNTVDRHLDTFYGEPLTTAWDKLRNWEPTGHGVIDVVATYDGDNRSEVAYCRALDDGELALNTDHFLVEAGYNVGPV